MSLQGVRGRIAWVDLATQETKIEAPREDLYLKYLGGYGLAAYLLYTRQRPGVDPLGPENVFGLTTGPLTGTAAVTGNRFTAVGKSPKTGGWGDANCGGTFGPALKQAGLDAVYFSGISEKPVYVLVEGGRVTLHDASDLWGLPCGETEARLKDRHGKNARSAVVGPAGERRSLLACIINDAGRAAGRSGLGAVMGSKRVKAVVAVGGGEVPVADDEKLKALRKEILSTHYQVTNPMYEFFHNYGTPGGLESSVRTGDAPIKNWMAPPEAFAGAERIGGEAVRRIQMKPYGCWRCPIACGGRVKVEAGPYAGEGHKPEYETLGAFGTMCLNDNLESICRLNNLCNDFGLDTISTGAVVAFALECFDKGLISEADTGGLRLAWGNHQAVVELTEQIARGEGFGGKVLGDGVRRAAERIGGGAEAAGMECGGEELPMHDPRCFPGLGVSYVADATPGRHTQYGSWFVEGNMLPEDLDVPKIAGRYVYRGKGEAHQLASCFGHVVNAAGVCMFASMITPGRVLSEYLTLALGRPFTLEDVLTVGERIANLRIAFNLREGIRNVERFRLPGRVLGNPPLPSGPTQGVTVDNDTQIRDYYETMGWDPETGVPRRAVFERLGLDFALEVTRE